MSRIEPPAWLDKEFLESTLSAGYNKSLSISKYDVSAASAKGDNYTSNMYRVAMETTGNRMISVVIKHLLEAGNAGTLLRQSTAYLRETQMLSVVLPKLTALLHNLMSEKFESFAAQHIFSREGLLILEDLCSRGFKMAERREGLDLAHCLIVMRTIGRFHAASVVLHEQDPDCMAPFQQSLYTEPQNKKLFSNMFSGLLNNAASDMEKCPELARFAGKIREFAKDALGNLNRTTARDDDAFNVLNHGDLWVNNILFRYSNTEQPEAVRFVDYQLSHYTSPAIDLQYFMYTSPRDEVRERHTDTLLQEYHGALCETLKALGYSQKLITLEELQAEYERKSVLGMFEACALLPIAMSESDSVFDFDDSLEDGVTHTSMYSEEKYRSVILRMMPLFEQKGVFQNM